jgi:hypothetical protein
VHLTETTELMLIVILLACFAALLCRHDVATDKSISCAQAELNA